MPYQISWMVPGQTMLVTLSGQVTEEELRIMTDESYQMVIRASGKVHAIVDQSKVEKMPTTLKTFTRSMTRTRHPNQGITVLVLPGMNPVGKFISTTLMQIIGLEYRMAQNIQEAQDIISRLH